MVAARRNTSTHTIPSIVRADGNIPSVDFPQGQRSSHHPQRQKIPHRRPAHDRDLRTGKQAHIPKALGTFAHGGDGGDKPALPVSQLMQPADHSFLACPSAAALASGAEASNMSPSLRNNRGISRRARRQYHPIPLGSANDATTKARRNTANASMKATRARTNSANPSTDTATSVSIRAHRLYEKANSAS